MLPIRITLFSLWYFGALPQASAQGGFAPMMMMTPRMNCGVIEDGANAVRYMYAAASASEPSVCVAETQTATCNNGTLSAYSGTSTNTSCTASRARYSTASTTCPTACASQTQTQVCTNGSCGAWSGSYAATSCTQNPTSQSMSIWKKFLIICSSNGTASRSCSVSSNTVAGTWGGWSPNASNYYSNSSCSVRY